MGHGVSEGVQFLVARPQIGGVFTKRSLCLHPLADVTKDENDAGDFASVIPDGRCAVVNRNFRTVFGNQQDTVS